MLVGLAAFAAGRIEGLEGLLYYGAAYSVMNLGAFAVVAAIQRRAGVTSGLDTFAGLVRREPWLAILMTLFLLSLTGIPPTAGFFAKYYVILAARPGRARPAGPRSGSSPSSPCSTPRRPRSTTCASSSTCSCASRRPRSAPLAHGRLLWGGLVVASVLTVAPGPRSRARSSTSSARRPAPSAANPVTRGRTGPRPRPAKAARDRPNMPTAPGSAARLPAVDTIAAAFRYAAAARAADGAGRRAPRERPDDVHDRRRAAAGRRGPRDLRAAADDRRRGSTCPARGSGTRAGADASRRTEWRRGSWSGASTSTCRSCSRPTTTAIYPLCDVAMYQPLAGPARPGPRDVHLRPRPDRACSCRC